MLLLPFQLAMADDLSNEMKSRLNQSLKDREEQSWDAALKIWEWAEPGYQEKQSAKLLAGIAEKGGMKVRRGVADIPTAFVASYGTEKPIIAFLGEFDALPGLSQTSSPVREVRTGANYGHGCGHHLLGVGSLAAALAIVDQIKSGHLKGTVRYYGCPAEEGGSAKVFMVQAGLFDDCDVVLHWHPGNRNSAGTRSTLARIAVKFRFHGKAAHAAGAPEQGRSALDAVELTNHAAQLLREHTPEKTRIHHVITQGGSAPNVVPNLAEVYYYIRHPDADVVRDLYRRLVLCAKAGALATETKLEIRHEGGIWPILPNSVLARVMLSQLKSLNDLEYTEEDLAFLARLLPTLTKPGQIASIHQVYDRSGSVTQGSTDVGDISWKVPTIGLSTACWAPGTPAHSWQAVSCGARPMARRGMNLASCVLSHVAAELMQNDVLIEQAKQEHQERLKAKKYQTLMQPGQKPALDYRKGT